eukprot:Colp12_sorted_trinity150504_noHs@26427
MVIDVAISVTPALATPPTLGTLLPVTAALDPVTVTLVLNVPVTVVVTVLELVVLVTITLDDVWGVDPVAEEDCARIEAMMLAASVLVTARQSVPLYVARLVAAGAEGR